MGIDCALAAKASRAQLCPERWHPQSSPFDVPAPLKTTCPPPESGRRIAREDP